jgi:hypothetical protein
VAFRIRRRRRNIVTLGEMLRGWVKGFAYIFLAVALVTIVSSVGSDLMGLATITTPIQTGTDANGNPTYLTIDLGWIFNVVSVFAAVLGFLYGVRLVLRVRI